MKDFFENRPFSKIGILALPLLIFIIIMGKFFPKSGPDGFQSFIIAFEFAKTPEQIHLLFKDFTQENFNNINKGNYFDFGFMLTYSLFLFLFFRQAAKFFNQKWLLAGVALSVVALIADFSENLCLLEITNNYTPEIQDNELISVLKKLHLITWLKWEGLAVIFALFSIKIFGKNMLSNIEGVVLVFPLLFSIWAMTENPQGISKFTLSISLAFLLLLFYSFHFKKE